LLNNCKSIKPDAPDTILIPEAGFKLVQHTYNKDKRLKNSLYTHSRKIEEYEFNTVALDHFISELRSSMHKWNGVGIAANQVNKNIQIFIIEADRLSLWHDSLETVPFQVFINPKITNVSYSKNNFWHGCLSANNEKLGNVATYDWIEYEAYDSKGDKQRGRLSGFSAVIFQHEMRHLLGGTYLDKAMEFVAVKDFYKKLTNNELTFFEKADDNLPLLLDDYVINKTLEENYTINKLY